MTRPDYASSVERAVLGLMLLEPSLVLRAERVLTADDFEDARHARIFETAVTLGRAGRDTSAGAIAIEMRRTGAMEDEDERYLGVLVTDPGATDPRAFDERVKALRDEGNRRRAIAAMAEAAKSSRDRERPLAESIGDLRKTLGEIEAADGAEELPPISASVDEVLSTLESGIDPGTPTGLPNLDFAIQGGIKNSQMIVIAGSTGSGKTSLATQIAILAAQWASRERTKRGWVLIFSLEMSATELTIRMVSQVASITDGYRPPEGFSRRDRIKVRAALERIRELPIRVEVPRRSTVEGIRASIERFIGVHGKPSLVVVDHIGLLKDPKVKGGRTEEVGSITRNLKEMAMQLDLPVLALAQLNREVGKRDDHRPQLTDLRESGSIEQDSNAVLLVYRPSYYLKDLEERRRLEETGKAEAYVMVAKNRSGPTSEVLFYWRGPRYLFAVPPDWTAQSGLDDSYGIIEDPDAIPEPSDSLRIAGQHTPESALPVATTSEIELKAAETPAPLEDDNPFA